MNLLDYVSKTHVKTAKFEYDGQELEFFYRDLTGEEAEKITDKLAGIMAMIGKQKKDPDYMPTSDELKDINLQRDFTLMMQLCDEAGGRLYDTVEDMRKVIPAKILDLASKATAKVTTEVAEKNSRNLSGSDGYSDSQTDKTVVSNQSSKTIQQVN